MKQPELSPRLQLLADWVTPGARVADVGTDHGYLPVWLRLREQAPHVIAGDLRRGPLERAKATGARYGADGIDFRLCDGLAAIAPEEADTIVIAGMGGETITSILSAAPWTGDGRHTLLLQPMTKAPALRLFLAEHGYAISREALVRDRGTIYPVMEVTAGRMVLTLGQQYGGVKLGCDPLGDRMLIEMILRLQMAVGGLHRSLSSAEVKKADHLRDILSALLVMREEWRHANGSKN